MPQLQQQELPSAHPSSSYPEPRFEKGYRHFGTRSIQSAARKSPSGGYLQPRWGTFVNPQMATLTRGSPDTLAQSKGLPLTRIAEARIPPTIACQVLEFHHHHVRKFHSLARGRDSRQQVIPLSVVSEAQNKFIHHPEGGLVPTRRNSCEPAIRK